jgi:hypothetical protein
VTFILTGPEVFLQREIVTYSTTDGSRGVLVDPQFAIEPRDVVDFLAEFGPFNNRYIPRYPSDWASRLSQHVEDIAPGDPVKRQAIFERIRREALLCTVPIGWKWDGDSPWRTNVQKFFPSDRKPLVVGHGLDPAPFSAWVEALDEIRETRRRSWPFRGAIPEYVEACLPLLLNSPSSYLIDPYLDIFSETGEMILRSLFDRSKGSRCYSIQVITRRGACNSANRSKVSTTMTDLEIGSLLRKIYKGILPKDREIRLHLVTEGNTGDYALRLHDRFFLTTHGAINFGQGFFVVNQPQPQQNAYVLDKDHHLVLKQNFIDGVARFNERLPRLPTVAYPLQVDSFSCRSDG